VDPAIPPRRGAAPHEGDAAVTGRGWTDRTGASVALVATIVLTTVHLAAVELVAWRTAVAVGLLAMAAVGRTVDVPARWAPDRRTISLAFGGVAAVVALVALPDLLTLDERAGDGGRILAVHALLAAAVTAAAFGTTTTRRRAVAITFLAQVAAAWHPGAPVRTSLVLAWLATALAFLALETLTERHGARPADPADPRGQARSRQRALRHALVLLALLPVLAPLVAAAVPPDQSARGPSMESGSGPSSGAPLSATDDLDTSLRFDPGNEVVLRVAASAPDYWRGRSFDTWDGRTWTASGSSYVRLTDGPGETTLPGSLGSPWMETVRSERFPQTFTVELGGSDLLVAAYEPFDVRAPTGMELDTRDGSIRFDRPLSEGDVYSVVSERPIVTAATLRDHDPADGSRPVELDGYVQLPPDLPDRVAALAREVAGAAPTTYDGILALEAWISAHTSYSLDVPVPPPGVDAVDQFLFVDRQGFCVQIASSLAVLLRTLDVPARVAVGYAGGDQDALSGVFTVRQSDAHAWVEVWFPEVGWQAFDPTADVPLSGEYHPSLLRRLVDLVHRLRWFLVAIACALVLTFVGRALVQAVRRRGRRPWAEVMAERLAREGRSRGRPRAPHETITEYGRALRASVLPDGRIDELARAISDAAFSAHPPDAATATAWRAELRAVARAHPPRRWWRRRSAAVERPAEAPIEEPVEVPVEAARH
jgi:transglutaminase-like putative cysteine protease